MNHGAHSYMENNLDISDESEALSENYRKINESFSQFLFLTFIPNSWQNSVEVFIDEGDFRVTFPIPEFLDKIEMICGAEERTRLAIACNNLGIPFFYDREHKKIIELKEKPKKENLNVNMIRSLGMDNYNTSAKNNNLDNMYSGLKEQFNSLIQDIMNNK